MKKIGTRIRAVMLAAFVLDFSLTLPVEAYEAQKTNSSVAKGQAIFQENCDICHYSDKTETKIGPGLKGLFKKKELPQSHKPATTENVRRQIEEGSPEAVPVPMPAFKDTLTPAEVDNLLQYLKTL